MANSLELFEKHTFDYIIIDDAMCLIFIQEYGFETG